MGMRVNMWVWVWVIECMCAGVARWLGCHRTAQAVEGGQIMNDFDAAYLRWRCPPATYDNSHLKIVA